MRPDLHRGRSPSCPPVEHERGEPDRRHRRRRWSARSRRSRITSASSGPSTRRRVGSPSERGAWRAGRVSRRRGLPAGDARSMSSEAVVDGRSAHQRALAGLAPPTACVVEAIIRADARHPRRFPCRRSGDAAAGRDAFVAAWRMPHDYEHDVRDPRPAGRTSATRANSSACSRSWRLASFRRMHWRIARSSPPRSARRTRSGRTSRAAARRPSAADAIGQPPSVTAATTDPRPRRPPRRRRRSITSSRSTDRCRRSAVPVEDRHRDRSVRDVDQ